MIRLKEGCHFEGVKNESLRKSSRVHAVFYRTKLAFIFKLIENGANFTALEYD